MTSAPLLAAILFLAAALPAPVADTVVVFSEVMYHPTAASSEAEAAAEWIELHNQMAVDVDVSGWSITGGVDYVFPKDTVILAGTYLTVAAVPENVPGSIGGWNGRLSNSGERIELRNNNGRLMDELSWGTDGDWPSAPDGGGPSLAKRAVNLASDDPASWRSSSRTGGTPGAENFPARVATDTGPAGPPSPLLLNADGVSVLDSYEVKATARGRYPDGLGAWVIVSAETPSAANAVTLRHEVVINEIMYDYPSATLLPPSAPRPGQWIELHNRSGATVDLSGWQLTRAVSFRFPPRTSIAAGDFLIVAADPAAAMAGYGLPAAKVFGPWRGNLSRSSERLVLEDAAGNTADDVTYFSEGRWPVAANGGGSSLELRDPDADNSVAESWAASDESRKAEWQTFTWRGPNIPSQAGEPTIWNELALLLVDGPGELLIDDVKVTDTTTNTDLIQNGDFSSGATTWRRLGNHRTSRVVAEPGNPANQVLHVIATGPGEYQGNQIETTFAGNTALVADREYEVSLRARWLSGAGRLNTRLYFNRLPRTHVLSVVSNGGTPAAPNSRLAANLGPSLTGLAHSPVVPAANEPVTVSVEAADADGVAGVRVKYSASGGAWQTVAMTSVDNRRFSGQIPGQLSGVIQFYVESVDTLGTTSVFPSRAADSRALIQVEDGQGSGTQQRVRLVMTSADASDLHAGNNTLSNEYLGATIVLDETETFYDVGVRLKGSFVGRNVPRVGFVVRFNSDQRFRGVHDTIAIDRSQHTAVGQGEIVARHIAAHAGGIPEMYDDLCRFIHTDPAYSSSCQLRIAGFDDLYLDGQFPDGSDSTMYEIEVLRWHTTTEDGHPESTKVVSVSANGYANLELQDWGADKEAYRWQTLQSSHRAHDDFTAMMAVARMFGMPAGPAFDAEARQRLDHDAWLRTLAYMSLVGPSDAAYTGSNLHNYRIMIRAHDGRAMMMPWDWDSAFQSSPTSPLIGSSHIAKVVTSSPDAIRRYYHHLYDIVRTTFNQAYMTRWTTHYGSVAGENYGGIQRYINSRAAHVLSQLPTTTAFTATAGAVSANGMAAITGTAAIDVAVIEVNGLVYTPRWTGTTEWHVIVPVPDGEHALTIRGLTRDGSAVTAWTFARPPR